MAFQWTYPPLARRDEVGKRIYALRTLRRMTQEQFAERIGAGRTQVNNWEKGKRYPDPEAWARICEFTGATSDYLLLGRSSTLPTEMADALWAIQREAESPDK